MLGQQGPATGDPAPPAQPPPPPAGPALPGVESERPLLAVLREGGRGHRPRGLASKARDGDQPLGLVKTGVQVSSESKGQQIEPQRGVSEGGDMTGRLQCVVWAVPCVRAACPPRPA